MGNSFNPYYSSIVTHEYNPYNTHSSTITGYNVSTKSCNTTK